MQFCGHKNLWTSALIIYFQKFLSYFLLHKHLISLISLTLKSIKTGAQQVNHIVAHPVSIKQMMLRELLLSVLTRSSNLSR